MRLIDADKLKADLEKAISKNEDMDCLDFLRVASVIDAQPTAYDQKKVVEQLEKEKEIHKRFYNISVYKDMPEIKERYRQTISISDKAIEIVKAVGADAEH